jgi:hypothetical protein
LKKPFFERASFGVAFGIKSLAGSETTQEGAARISQPKMLIRILLNTGKNNLA